MQIKNISKMVVLLTLVAALTACGGGGGSSVATGGSTPVVDPVGPTKDYAADGLTWQARFQSASAIENLYGAQFKNSVDTLAIVFPTVDITLPNILNSSADLNTAFTTSTNSDGSSFYNNNKFTIIENPMEIKLPDGQYSSHYTLYNEGILIFNSDGISTAYPGSGEYTDRPGGILNDYYGITIFTKPFDTCYISGGIFIVENKLTVDEITSYTVLNIDILAGEITTQALFSSRSSETDYFKIINVAFFVNDRGANQMSWLPTTRTVFTYGKTVSKTGSVKNSNEDPDNILLVDTELYGRYAGIGFSVNHVKNTDGSGSISVTYDRSKWTETAVAASASANAMSVAAALDSAYDYLDENHETADKDFVSDSMRVLLAPAADVDEFLRSASGELHASSQALQFQQARAINRDLTNRLAMFRNTNDTTGAGVWGNALGSTGKIEKDGYTSADTKMYGFQAGADKYFTDKFLGGVALAATKATADFDKYGGDSDSTNITASLYGAYGLGATGKYYVSGRVGAGYIDAETSREVLIGSTTHKVTGNHDDMMYSAYAELGAKYGFAGNYWFNPFVGYSYDLLDRASFIESGSTYALDVKGETYDYGQGHVGVRVGGLLGPIKAQVHAEAAFGSENDLAFDAKLAGDSSNSYMHVKGVPLADTVVNVGASLEGDINANTTVYGSYECTIEDSSNHVFSLGMRYKF